MSLKIARTTLDDIRDHAEAAYPDECCGVVTSNGSGGQVVRRCRNIQNQLHAQDPSQHPRDARTAYYIDPTELLAITRELDRSGGELVILYHSHPDHDAYFSAEDRARAVMEGWDEPAYPGLAYVVVSVRDGAAVAEKAFVWDADSRDFNEQPVLVDV